MPSTSSTGAGTVTTSRVVADLEAADVVVVVNPDNPTGRLLPPQALRAVTARLLIVDEAFIDLLPQRGEPCRRAAGQCHRSALLRQDLWPRRPAAGLRHRADAARRTSSRRAGAVGGVRPGARDRRDGVDRRCVAAGGGSSPCRRCAQARRTVGLGRIHDAGRHAAVQAGEPSRGAGEGRRPRAPRNPCPRLRRSADVACASACRAAMRNSAACQRRFRCRRRCDRRTGRKAPARRSRRIRRAPRRAGPAPSGIPRTGRNRRARSPRPAPPRRDDCAGCRRD